MKNPVKSDALYVTHILDQILMIDRIMVSAAEKEIRYLALIRCFEVIGEAAKHISVEFRARHADIPWSKMIGMRNALVHDYLGVEEKDVWNTAKTDIPALKNQLLALEK